MMVEMTGIVVCGSRVASRSFVVTKEAVRN